MELAAPQSKPLCCAGLALRVQQFSDQGSDGHPNDSECMAFFRRTFGSWCFPFKVLRGTSFPASYSLGLTRPLPHVKVLVALLHGGRGGYRAPAEFEV